MRNVQRPLLVVCFFVCPLLFFTNLTRTPYITQIALLNISLLLAAAAYMGSGAGLGLARLPRTPVDAPLWAWVGVCFLSWSVAYLGHAAFYRPAMLNEGTRNLLFLL